MSVVEGCSQFIVRFFLCSFPVVALKMKALRASLMRGDNWKLLLNSNWALQAKNSALHLYNGDWSLLT